MRRLGGYIWCPVRELSGSRQPDLRGLVADESNNHAVEVEEEHDQVEAQLDERLLRGGSAICMTGSDNQRRTYTFLWTLSFRKISVASSKCVLSTILVTY